MDLATILGLVIGFAMVVLGIITSTANPTVAGIIDAFVDIPSIAVTIGGSIAGLLASYTFKTFLGHLKGFSIAMKDPKLDNAQVISKIIELSNTARKEGLLSLEEAAGDIDDAFLKKGIMLVVDGTDPELVRGIMETEMVSIDDRHKKNIGFWDNVAGMGPAWGMIGTLVGLIMMLYHMEDASTIGPAMAVALVTTFYGSLLATWICTPIATKLKAINNAEMQVKEIMIEGLLSIQAGENPRVIEEKLKSFLSPIERSLMGGDNEGGE